MRHQIRNLAGLIKQKQKTPGAKRTVLFLGAGASISSGVKSAEAIMEEVVRIRGSGMDGSIADRFDQIWRSSTAEQRAAMLDSLLEANPSEGYEKLAQIIRDGYIDIIITFNFDNLLTKALCDAGIPSGDIKVMIRGETQDEAMRPLVESPKPRIKILKLHGSLHSTNTFLFSKQEMLEYPKPLESLLRELTARDIIVCGYKFTDLCVISSFAKEGDSIFCVNPAGATGYLNGYLVNRNSEDWVFDEEYGDFDRFFSCLHEDLSSLGPGAAALPPIRCNPFKFFEPLKADEPDLLVARDEEIRKVIATLEKGEKHIIQITGAKTAGKTSFVRAGIMSSLERDHFESVYLRCPVRPSGDVHGDISEYPQLGVTMATLPDVLAQLAQECDKKLVVMIDQFERIVEATESGGDIPSAPEIFRGLCEKASENLILVFLLVPSSKAFTELPGAVQDFMPRFEFVNLLPLKPESVERMLGVYAEAAGRDFDKDTVTRIVKAYRDSQTQSAQDEGTSERAFTLGHVHAYCHLLLGDFETGEPANGASLSGSLRKNLNIAINHYDISNYLEDYPREDERKLLRNIMKIISIDSRERLAERLQKSLSDLSNGGADVGLGLPQ